MTFFAVGAHFGHQLKPGADQRLAQCRVVTQGFGVDDGQILDVARNLTGVEHTIGARLAENLVQQRVPGDNVTHILRVVSRDHIRIAGVDHSDIALAQASRVQRAGQQIVRYRQLDQIDLLPLHVGNIAAVFHDNAVVAVGIIADDQRRSIHTTGRGD